MKHSADRGRWLIKVTTNLKQKYLMEILGFTEPFAKPLPVSVYLKPDRSCVVQNPRHRSRLSPWENAVSSLCHEWCLGTADKRDHFSLWLWKPFSSGSASYQLIWSGLHALQCWGTSPGALPRILSGRHCLETAEQEFPAASCCRGMLYTPWRGSREACPCSCRRKLELEMVLCPQCLPLMVPDSLAKTQDSSGLSTAEGKRACNTRTKALLISTLIWVY